MGRSIINPIGLSFKNTPEDIKLYEWINSHSGKSAFIKDILRRAMEEEERRTEEAQLPLFKSF